MTDKEVVELSTCIRIGYPELTKSELTLLSMQFKLRKETHRLMRKVTNGGNPLEARYNYEILPKASGETALETGVSGEEQAKRTVSLDHRAGHQDQGKKADGDTPAARGVSATAADSRSPNSKKADKKARQARVAKEKQRGAQSQVSAFSNHDSSTMLATIKLSAR